MQVSDHLCVSVSRMFRNLDKVLSQYPVVQVAYPQTRIMFTAKHITGVLIITRILVRMTCKRTQWPTRKQRSNVFVSRLLNAETQPDVTKAAIRQQGGREAVERYTNSQKSFYFNNYFISWFDTTKEQTWLKPSWYLTTMGSRGWSDSISIL